MGGFFNALKQKEGAAMTLIELARIASRYDTDIAHALLQAVAFAMYDPACTFPVGSEVIESGKP